MARALGGRLNLTLQGDDACDSFLLYLSSVLVNKFVAVWLTLMIALIELSWS